MTHVAEKAMDTGKTAGDSAAGNAGSAERPVDKAHEKRRALGRGLDALLPGRPRVVAGTAARAGSLAGTDTGLASVPPSATAAVAVPEPDEKIANAGTAGRVAGTSVSTSIQPTPQSSPAALTTEPSDSSAFATAAPPRPEEPSNAPRHTAFASATSGLGRPAGEDEASAAAQAARDAQLARSGDQDSATRDRSGRGAGIGDIPGEAMKSDVTKPATEASHSGELAAATSRRSELASTTPTAASPTSPMAGLGLPVTKNPAFAAAEAATRDAEFGRPAAHHSEARDRSGRGAGIGERREDDGNRTSVEAVGGVNRAVPGVGSTDVANAAEQLRQSAGTAAPAPEGAAHGDVGRVSLNLGHPAVAGIAAETLEPHSYRNGRELNGTPIAEDSNFIGDLQAAAGPRRTAEGYEVLELPLDKIDRNPYQTRYYTEEDDLALVDLSLSIKAQGVIQPITVRPGKEGRYILIAGDRRTRASRMAEKATIPAIVRAVSDEQAAMMTIIENLLREDLNCMDQTRAFMILSQKFKLTQVQIADRVGCSREKITNYMRLARLPKEVQDWLTEGKLEFSHARLLLKIDDDEYLLKVAKKVVEENIRVEDLEDMMLGSRPEIPAEAPERQSRGARWVDPNVRAAQRDLERVLGMRVRIRDRNNKGKITIEYGTLEDFDRVVKMLRGK